MKGDSWVNVLIEPKEIVATVSALERQQAIVVLAVSGLHPVRAFIAQIVHVNAAHPERLKDRVHLMRPGDVRFVVGRRPQRRRRRRIAWRQQTQASALLLRAGSHCDRM